MSIWKDKYQGKQSDKTVDPWERLFAWTPESEPPGFRENYASFYDDEQFDEDADAPFLSEAYLYNLLGKEDARTFFALLHRAMIVAGIDPVKIEQDIYREEE